MQDLKTQFQGNHIHTQMHIQKNSINPFALYGQYLGLITYWFYMDQHIGYTDRWGKRVNLD